MEDRHHLEAVEEVIGCDNLSMDGIKPNSIIDFFLTPSDRSVINRTHSQGQERS
jgi:hypothetical protein